ncbi:MAG: electron transporter RnfB [Erysipelotrichaceae bacterium]|nr:electron transporter RnfB [Erysipelotrichaceae bacterium]
MLSFLIAFVVMLVIGALLGVLLSIAKEKFHVEEEDKRLQELIEMLPGYNCGSCGYSGCGGMAEAIVSGELDIIPCNPLKQKDREKIIEYLKTTPGPDGSTIDIK